MPKEKTSNTQKTAGTMTNNANATTPSQPLRTVPAPAPTSSAPNNTRTNKKRASSKGNRPQVGGSAVSGAKSTQPRPITESKDPNQQQIDSYNRTMRRRMEHIGAGPYAQEGRMESMKRRREKKVEQRQERRVEAQQELKTSMRGFGKRNLYFFFGTVALVVLIIVIYVLLRVYHVFG